jgi:hypothetical protein
MTLKYAKYPYGKRRKFERWEINSSMPYGRHIKYAYYLKELKESIPYWSDKQLVILEESTGYRSLTGYKIVCWTWCKRTKVYFTTLEEALLIAQANGTIETREELIASWTENDAIL